MSSNITGLSQALNIAVLNLSRYQLRLRAQERTLLPIFLGSTLRGAFGQSLKNVVCVMNHRDCAKCLVREQCIYPYVFETTIQAKTVQWRGQQATPHPFILTLQSDINNYQQSDYQRHRREWQKDDELIFELLLMGRAIDYLPYIIYTISEMSKRGLGASRTPFLLTNVSIMDQNNDLQSVYDDQTEQLSLPPEKAVMLPHLIGQRINSLNIDEQLSLAFLTPTRIRVAGDLQAGIDFQLLIRNLFRRISILASVYGQQWQPDFRDWITRAGQISTKRSALRWLDLERYSNRQQTKMKFGGFVGEVDFIGAEIKEFLPLIVAGEILHIGTATTFGLGRYQIINN